MATIIEKVGSLSNVIQWGTARFSCKGQDGYGSKDSIQMLQCF